MPVLWRVQCGLQFLSQPSAKHCRTAATLFDTGSSHSHLPMTTLITTSCGYETLWRHLDNEGGRTQIFRGAMLSVISGVK